MSVFQVSKIQFRRGPEQDLPGAPTSLSPLTFEPGLDVGEIGFTVDSGRLFIGQLPSVGQPNYARTTFPYQNIEILTESSVDALRSIFNFLRRDEGSGAFYRATLLPTEDGIYQDVKVERALGTLQAFHIAGEDLIGSIEYYVIEQDSQGLTPLRNGTLRVMSESCADDCLLKDDALTLRRLDLTTPDALDVNKAYENVAFKVTRGGTISERYFRFMYTTTALDLPVTLYFRVTRPLTDTISATDFGVIDYKGAPGTGSNFTVSDIQDIVGEMVTKDTQVGINVTYNNCAGKLDFRTLGQTVQSIFSFNLNLTGDVLGAVNINSDATNFTIPVSLPPTGVSPGRYTNASVTVDQSGRVTAITSGTSVVSDPNAVYGGQNLGSGGEVYAAVNGRNLQFRSLVAGAGISVSETSTALTIAATQQVPNFVAGAGISLTTANGATTIGLTTGNTASSSDVLALQANASVQGAQIQALQANVAAVQNNITTFQQQLPQVQQTLTQAGNSIQALLANASEQGSQIAALQAGGSTGGSTANSAQISALQSNVSVLQSNASAQGSQIQALQGNAAQMGGQIAALQAGGTGGSTANSAQISALQSNVSALQANTAQMGGQIAALQAASGSTGGSGTPQSNVALSYAVSQLQATVYGTSTSTGSAGSHKAWRLRIDNTQTPAYCSLAEMQFRTTAGVSQQATGGFAFSTATGNGTSPNDAFDGNSGNRWVADYPNTPYPKYLGYVFASAISVAEVMLQASNYYTEMPVTGGIEYSDNTTNGLDGDWAQASPFSTTPTWVDGEIRLFAVGTSYSNVAGLQANVATLQSNVATLQPAVAALQSNSGVTPGTYTLSTITVDARGRVTSAASGTASSGGSTGGTVTASTGFLPITLDTSATVKTPKLADFTFVDSGTTRTNDAAAGISYFMGASGTSTTTAFSQWLKPISYTAGTGLTITCGFTMTFLPWSFQGGGLTVVDSNGRFVTMEVLQNNSGYSLEQNNWNSFNSYNGTNWSLANANQVVSPRGIWWQKMQISSNGISIFLSPDGVDYWLVAANNTFVTAPARAGFLAKASVGNNPTFLKGTLFHFDVQSGLV